MNLPVQVPEGARFSIEHLKEIATRQRHIQLCILGNISLGCVSLLLPEALRWVLGLVYLPIALYGLFCVVMLARRVYGPGIAILFGVLACVPCVNLIALLGANSRATWALKKNGIAVGLLGADPDKIHP